MASSACPWGVIPFPLTTCPFLPCSMRRQSAPGQRARGEAQWRMHANDMSVSFVVELGFSLALLETYEQVQPVAPR